MRTRPHLPKERSGPLPGQGLPPLAPERGSRQGFQPAGEQLRGGTAYTRNFCSSSLAKAWLV